MSKVFFSTALVIILMSGFLCSGFASVIFEDDFEDGVIDPGLWTLEQHSGSVTESDGFLKLSYLGGSAPHTQVRTNVDLIHENMTFTIRIKPGVIPNPDKNIGFWLGDIDEGSVTGFAGYFHSKELNYFWVHKLQNYNGINHADFADAFAGTSSWPWTSSEYYSVHEIVITKADNVYTFFVDGVQTGQDTDQSTQPSALHFSLGRPWMDLLPGEYGEVFLDEIKVEAEPSVITVEIDIKPGSDTNPINLKSKGVIAVAILTTDEFDATTVDPLSVKFGSGEATECHEKCHIEDVDGDGDLDMVLHFRTQETGIQNGDVEACLIGETVDGEAIEGCDNIVTVGKASKAPSQSQQKITSTWGKLKAK